jgi:hypothetical protein
MTTSTTCGDRYKDGCNFFETEDSFPDPHNGKIKYILPPLCILFLTLNFTVEEIELVSVLLQPFQ